MLKRTLLSMQTLVFGSLSIIIVALLGGGWALQGDGTGPVDTTWQRLQENPVIVVGVDPNLPPFGIHDPAGPRGLDVDLANALAAEMGFQIRFVLLSYDGIFDALLRGDVDMVIAALRPDPHRTDHFRYSQPYFDAGQVFVGPAGEQLPTGFAALKRQTLAVEFASEANVEARQFLSSKPGAFRLLESVTAREAMVAVVEGAADYALVDTVTAHLTVQEYPALQVSRETVVPDPYVVAIRRSDWRLFMAVEEALATLRHKGVLQDIIDRWLKSPVQSN
ncbi:MAG: amino acid ABC transporter substrate-binding protein [Chloroflexi bacterium]|nr:amino acid ABC transporter substrate-binding protein [Chloroflexota bacterium]